MTISTTIELSAGTVPFRFPFTIVEVCMAVLSLSIPFEGVHIEWRRSQWYMRSWGRPEAETIDQGLQTRVRIFFDDLESPVVFVRISSPEFRATMRTSITLAGIQKHAAIHSPLSRNAE
jgi:hypothetical protein